MNLINSEETCSCSLESAGEVVSLASWSPGYRLGMARPHDLILHMMEIVSKNAEGDGETWMRMNGHLGVSSSFEESYLRRMLWCCALDVTVTAILVCHFFTHWQFDHYLELKQMRWVCGERRRGTHVILKYSSSPGCRFGRRACW